MKNPSQGSLTSFGYIVVYGKDEWRINDIIYDEKLPVERVIKLDLFNTRKWFDDLIGAPICLVYGIDSNNLLQFGAILSKDEVGIRSGSRGGNHLPVG